MLDMTPLENPWSYITLYVVLYIIFSTFVYAGVEFIKSIYKIFSNDKPISNKKSKFINFILAYIYAWIFKFKLVDMLLQITTEDGTNKLASHVNYFIVATLIYVGAKQIWQYVSKIKKITEEANVQ